MVLVLRLLRVRVLEEVAPSADAADAADAPAADARRLEPATSSYPAAAAEAKARSSAANADASLTLSLTSERRRAVVERGGAAGARREEQRWECRVGHRNRLFLFFLFFALVVQSRTAKKCLFSLASPALYCRKTHAKLSLSLFVFVSPRQVEQRGKRGEGKKQFLAKFLFWVKKLRLPQSERKKMAI